MVWQIALSMYALASIVVSVLLALDKRAARRSGRRIRESTLHLVELAGGWPGSLVARRLLRHKTRKVRYRITFWLIAALHIAAWIAWAVWLARES